MPGATNKTNPTRADLPHHPPVPTTSTHRQVVADYLTATGMPWTGVAKSSNGEHLLSELAQSLRVKVVNINGYPAPPAAVAKSGAAASRAKSSSSSAAASSARALSTRGSARGSTRGSIRTTTRSSLTSAKSTRHGDAGTTGGAVGVGAVGSGGMVLFREGEPATTMYIMLSCTSSISLYERGRVVRTVQKAGESFGECMWQVCIACRN